MTLPLIGNRRDAALQLRGRVCEPNKKEPSVSLPGSEKGRQEASGMACITISCAEREMRTQASSELVVSHWISVSVGPLDIKIRKRHGKPPFFLSSHDHNICFGHLDKRIRQSDNPYSIVHYARWSCGDARYGEPGQG